MLAAAVRRLLDAQALGPPRASLSIAETRARYRAAAALAGTPATVDPVRDLHAGGVPVRVYGAGRDALVYLHGGRLISGDLETHDPVCRHLAAGSAWTVIAVDYRLAPEHVFPAAREDALTAVDWAAARYRRVVCGGDSAGGYLAAQVALARPLAGHALVYPMLDASRSLPTHTLFAAGYGAGSLDMERGYAAYLPEGMDRRSPDSSPLFAPNVAGLPPAYVLTAEYDSLRDEGEAWAARLRAAGVAVTSRRCSGMAHGFVQWGGTVNEAREALEDLCAWLRRL